MNTIKTSAVIAAFAVMSAPSIASAHCGSTAGSFAVSCEAGVKVMRHKARSSMPMGLTPAQTQIKIAKMQQKTAADRLAAQERIAMRQADLKAQKLSNEAYQNSVYERNTRRNGRTYYTGSRFGGLGFGVARPVVIRSGH